MCGRRPVRKLIDQRTVIHAVVQVREVELAHAHFFSPCQHGLEMRVRWMRPTAQAIADPHVNTFIQRTHSCSQLVEIDGICEGSPTIVDTKAK
jgi:hypothetical protein